MIKNLKAILYEITISDSVLDHIHGFQYNIYEIFIPAYKIFVNHQGVWKYYRGRYKNANKIKDIEIPIISGKILSDTVKFKEESNKICRQILRDGTRGLKKESNQFREREIPKKLEKEMKQTIKKLKGKKRK